METKTVGKKTEKVRERGRAFMLRYVLSLIFGWAFIGALVWVIGLVVMGIFGDKHNSMYHTNEFFAMLLTTLVIFAIAHLLLAFSVGGKVKLDEKAQKVTKVLGTIYIIGLIGMATGFAIMALFPLIGWLTALTDMEGREVAQFVIIGVIAMALLVKMMLYQIRIPARKPRWVYPVAMGLLTFIAIVLFLAIPVRASREAMKDQRIINDLDTIYYAVSNYVDDYGLLPENLEMLQIGGLNRSLSKYELILNGYNGNGYVEFTLCTSGFVRDMSGGKTQYGNFGNHKKGNDCFELRAYLGKYVVDGDWGHEHEHDTECGGGDCGGGGNCPYANDGGGECGSCPYAN